MDDFGILMGFAGIVIGAGITFLAEMTVLRKQMRFDMSVAVRETLLETNNALIKEQKLLLDYYSDSDKRKVKENINHLREIHLRVMEIYKMYRIHLGDQKAYELYSAVYKYYFEKVNADEKIKTIKREDYENAFSSLRYALGIMINNIRFELVRINSLKKITKDDKVYKQKENERYAQELDDMIDTYLLNVINDFELNKDNDDDLLYRAEKVLVKRLNPFYMENGFKNKVEDKYNL